MLMRIPRKYSQRYRLFITVPIWLVFVTACQEARPRVMPTGSTVMAPFPTKEIFSPVVNPTEKATPPPQQTRGLTSIAPTTDSTVIPTGVAQEQITQVCSPLEGHSLEDLRLITSDPYRPPPPGKDERHHGVDFSYYRWKERIGIQGVGVQAILPGKVAASLQDSFPFGNLVIVETPPAWLPVSLTNLTGIEANESLYILYAHMESTPLVGLGDTVQSCQLLGQVGKSGNAVEPHLHIETRQGPAGLSLEGMSYYQLDATDEEKQNYLLWRTSGVYQHFDPMLLLNWK